MLAKPSTFPEMHNEKKQKMTNKNELKLNQQFLSKDIMIKSVKDKLHGNLKMQQSSKELLSSSLVLQAISPRSLECSVCGEVFLQPSNVDFHMKWEHPD